ncbi:MAG: HutD family protein [Oscillospiraceae bacterium]|nr:HutD family protein [Oscillospiraceae bacterium]
MKRTDRKERPRLQRLDPSYYLTSSWSGGTTTQIAIWPPEAVYAERSFLWRVSSATVELEASDFTSLPDYERQIATLEGGIVLSHNGGKPIFLAPFEVHAFSGADATHSVGRCRDFNLMLRRDALRGSMEALELTEAPGRPRLCGPQEQLLLYCVEGTCRAECPELPEQAAVCCLQAGEALLLTGPGSLSMLGPARLMLCRMQPAGRS